MDKHHIANYAIGALALATAGGGAVYTAENPKSVETRVVESKGGGSWPAPSFDQVAAFRTSLSGQKPETIRIVCGGACDPLAETLEGAIDQAGLKSTEEYAFGSWKGLFVSPDSPEGQALAASLRQSLGMEVSVATNDDGGLAILIGKPPRK